WSSDVCSSDLVLEAAHAVQLGFAQPVEQVLEVLLGLAGETDDEGGADGQLRALLAPLADARQGLVLEGRTLHGLEHLGTGVLEGDVQVGQQLADRKSTRLNSSHVKISYAVFCLKKKK